MAPCMIRTGLVTLTMMWWSCPSLVGLLDHLRYSGLTQLGVKQQCVQGVCLTHYNLVANCMQAKVPGVMPRVLKTIVDDGVQETTIAVLPFFHIYSMELIMLLNLR